MATEPLKVIADIIRIELRLKNDQVVVYNQRFAIPTDDRLYVSVGLAGLRTFGSSNRHVPDPITGELISQQRINRQEAYSIHAYSRGSEARLRNWEIPLALKSDTAQRWQETNGMKIGEVPATMSDASELDGTAILNKYALLVNALVAYQKESSVPYFSVFSIPPVVVPNP